MSSAIKTRQFLPKKASKSIHDELLGLYGDAINQFWGSNENVEEGKVEGGTSVLIIKKELMFFKNAGDPWIPFLDVARKMIMKKIVIDQPAVPYISGGADVMRPGIVEIDDTILKDDLIAIVDQKNHVPVAIGKAMYDAADMETLEKGKAVKNYHHAGDKLWAMKKGT
jgi:PUA-domain protein